MSSILHFLTLFLFISQFQTYAVPMPKSNSQGRNLIQFANMIYRILDISPFQYNGYGCWCGYGGKGTPVDDTDACCQAHDQCYNKILTTRTTIFSCSPYFSFYKWKLDAKTRLPICKNQKDSCAYQVCDCDRTVIECYKKHVRTFNKTLKCTD